MTIEDYLRQDSSYDLGTAEAAWKSLWSTLPFDPKDDITTSDIRLLRATVAREFKKMSPSSYGAFCLKLEKYAIDKQQSSLFSPLPQKKDLEEIELLYKKQERVARSDATIQHINQSAEYLHEIATPLGFLAGMFLGLYQSYGSPSEKLIQFAEKSSALTIPILQEIALISACALGGSIIATIAVHYGKEHILTPHYNNLRQARRDMWQTIADEVQMYVKLYGEK